MTASTSNSATVRRTNSESLMSPTIKGPHFAAHRWPCTKLSRTTGRYPAAARDLHVWLPMYPAPPVTRIVISSPSRIVSPHIINPYEATIWKGLVDPLHGTAPPDFLLFIIWRAPQR